MQALLLAFPVILLLTPSLAAHVPWIDKRASGLKVELSPVKASSIRAVMTNTGREPLKLLEYGTLMDKHPVQVLKVVKDGNEVPFIGIDAQYRTDDIPENAFTTLAPDESFTSIIEIAALHDVTGGDYIISAVGAIPYAAHDSTDIFGSISYVSNVLSLNISPEQAEAVSPIVPVLEKRATLAGCTGRKASATKQALTQLVDVAQQAAVAATYGDVALFEKFYKTKDLAVRAAVADVLGTISYEAGRRRGLTTYYCQDPNGYCNSDTVTYSLPSQNVLVNCELFYTLPSLSSICGQQDQTISVLHELLHAPAVLKSTRQDLALGLEASLRLDSQQAVLNADNHAFYTNAVHNNC